MHYEGDTGSMEVIGVVSWGRGKFIHFLLFFAHIFERTILICITKNIQKNSSIAQIHRLCTTKTTWNLHTSRQLFAMDRKKKIGFTVHVYTKEWSSNRFLGSDSWAKRRRKWCWIKLNSALNRVNAISSQ